jgi:hypothetical protein
MSAIRHRRGIISSLKRFPEPHGAFPAEKQLRIALHKHILLHIT